MWLACVQNGISTPKNENGMKMFTWHKITADSLKRCSTLEAKQVGNSKLKLLGSNHFNDMQLIFMTNEK